MHHFEEEGHYFFGIHMACELVDQYRDRFWADIEKHRPDIYESFCAYKANQDVNEFITSELDRKYRDACDYWKDESND